jgi:hypothetical protein
MAINAGLGVLSDNMYDWRRIKGKGGGTFIERKLMGLQPITISPIEFSKDATLKQHYAINPQRHIVKKHLINLRI